MGRVVDMEGAAPDETSGGDGGGGLAARGGGFLATIGGGLFTVVVVGAVLEVEGAVTTASVARRASADKILHAGIRGMYVRNSQPQGACHYQYNIRYAIEAEVNP